MTLETTRPEKERSAAPSPSDATNGPLSGRPAERPLAVDLFCGRGGWTKGLLAAGFDVVGIDVELQPLYPGRFLQADVREVRGARFAGAQVVVASPPCTGFSIMNNLNRSTRGKRPRPADFELLAHALRVIGEVAPRFWAVENVSGAVAWFEPILGQPRARIRPFYLWGHFPGFMVPTSALVKVKTGAVGVSRRKTNKDEVWKNRRQWNGKDRDVVAQIAEIPNALARPFAEACMAAIVQEALA